MVDVKTGFVLGVVALIAGGATPGLAAVADAPAVERPTFYRDVLPILQENCQSCHRSAGANYGGMIAPMSLLDYKDVRPWARSIAKTVMAGEMPPWHAAPEFHGVFANERGLTEGERSTLIAWAKTGAAAGDPADAPAPIEFPSGGWAIGEPDLVLEMQEPYTIADEIEDQYVNFTVDVPLSEDRWVKGIEFKGGSDVVHHVIGYVIAPGQSFGTGERGMIGGIAPGNDPDEFPDGYGFLVPAGSKFVFAMHYHKEKGPGTAVQDQTQVAFKLYPRGSEPRQIHIEAIGNGLFEIPPHHESWQVGAARVFERPVKILYLMPHLHLRGKAARYEAFYPDGSHEVLLDVPRYDFNWQTSYEYEELKVIPAGTRLEVTLVYDNSDENAADVGFNSARAVSFGGPTTDEMDLGWLSFAYLDEAGEPTEITGGR